MPALSFQKRFVTAILSGKKRQTIRKRRKDGRDPKPGDTLYLYTGMRTTKCCKLGEARCTRADEISFGRMTWGEAKGYWFEGRVRSLCDVAMRNGFDSELELLEWFEKTHGLPFSGLLIRWGDLRVREMPF